MISAGQVVKPILPTAASVFTQLSTISGSSFTPRSIIWDTIARQASDARTKNDAFIRAPGAHALIVNTQGYAGPHIPQGATDSGGQLTYINAKAQALADMGIKVTIAARSFQPGENVDTNIYGARHGVEFMPGTQDRVRYLFVPDVEGEGAYFVRKEKLYPGLPAMARNLAAFVHDEADIVESKPWKYFDWLESHYVDAAVVAQRLVRSWAHEVACAFLFNNFRPVLDGVKEPGPFNDDNLVGNIAYHFGRMVVSAYKMNNNLSEDDVIAGPDAVEKMLEWAATAMGWDANDTARLKSLHKKGLAVYDPFEAADLIGRGLILTKGVGDSLAKKIEGVNRHVFTPHSLGRLKEDNVLSAGLLTKDPKQFRRLHLEEREYAERAVLGSRRWSASGLDADFASMPRAAALVYTSQVILETAYQLGWSSLDESIEFPPGIDGKVYFPRFDVDQPDIKALFKNFVDRRVMPEGTARAMIDRPQDFNVIIEAGRMDDTKRKHILVEAMRSMPANTVLFITGKDDGIRGVYSNLVKRIEDAKLGDRVFLLGRVPDEMMGPLMSMPYTRLNEEASGNGRRFRLAIIASASRMEGWGMAVADGTRGGLPLVATDYTPYAMHLARRGNAARIVRRDPGESVEVAGFVRELSALIENPQDAAHMASRGMEIAQIYEWSALTRRFVEGVITMFDVAGK